MEPVLIQDVVHCQNCDTTAPAVNNACVGCGEKICFVCGCTDSAACPGGCYWSRPGICSQCDADTAEEIEKQFIK